MLVLKKTDIIHKMMKPLLAFVFFFSFAGFIYSGPTVKIIPINPDTASESYSESGIPGTVLTGALAYYLSLYNGESDVSNLINSELSITNPPQQIQETASDFILYGSYTLSGNADSPDVLYRIQVYSRADRKVVFNKVYPSKSGLKLYSTAEKIANEWMGAVFGSGLAKISITSDTEFTKPVRAMVNGKKAAEFIPGSSKTDISIPSGQKVKLQLSELASGRNVYQSEFILNIGETSNIIITKLEMSPAFLSKTGLRIRLSTLDEMMGTVGVEYYLPQLPVWAGLSFGGSYYPSYSLLFSTGSMDLGYRVFSFDSLPISFGAGLTGRCSYVLSSDQLKSLLPAANPLHFSAGAFLEAELWGVVIRPVVYFDGSIYPNIALGYRF